jgi:hypothetical protein
MPGMPDDFTLVGLKNEHTHPTFALVSFFPKKIPKFPDL